MENELASLLFNFGIFGFLLYAGPFLAILIYAIIDVIKRLKKKLDTSYLMAISALGLLIILSYLSGYIFFNSSLIAIISVVCILILDSINKEKITE